MYKIISFGVREHGVLEEEVMKKKCVFGTGLLLLMVISGLFCFKKLNLHSGILSFEEIDVSKVYSAIQNKENLIVYYGQESCSACRVFTPTLEEAAKLAEQKVYFLDGDNLETKSFSKDYNIQGTPTLVIIQKGNVLRYEGVLGLEETVEVLSELTEKEHTV